MAIGKSAPRRCGSTQGRRVALQAQCGLHAFTHIRHAQRCAVGLGQLGGLQEIEGVRAHHHRAAAGGGFDQVLPAQRRKAAAQQGHIAEPVVQRHFAQRVTEPDLGLPGRVVVGGAAGPA